ncbi:hypothetical protein N7522_009162 [Penicillium canescens]|uniref:Methyltransferase domain-containing protein n=1 Tax=Penicillium canescens TaxID=5083 RepID=A0AAD6IE71_PENCN|nr:uncharacterized protein N7446_001879 [Penicillium canescens]KAJ5997502.1 hypothetical protein N7522_009162 [Penicillium canescens]KAJ6043683.1 hypothetical protein N7460_005038 [Penicillium canescens]KAJ6055154.1 hypothetical protein N7444_004252 [Penicillium canescens]KAJ6074102.1 hypothetical protein N7446_001879 [Penicillium canescens]
MSTIDTSVWFKSEIGPRLKPSIKLIFRQWSGLTDEELTPHLHRIRDQAWPLGEYPCIGLWMFLLPGIAAFPRFQAILETAKRPQAAILDLGCGLGQDLRLLATHGVSTERMWALDREAHLWGLGYELFRDHSRMRATFIHADFLQGSIEDERFELLRGQVDLVLASQFLHLFDWDSQLAACKKIVGLSKPGTMLVGFQQGRKRARAYIRPWGMMFYHNRDSFLRLWELVQQQTETQWTIDVSEVPLQDWGMQDEDLEWMPEDHTGVNFVIIRVS